MRTFTKSYRVPSRRIFLEGRIEFDEYDHPNQVVLINGIHLDPKPSLKVVNHSPDGFSWGYMGSGPSQLALAILLEVVSQLVALDQYMTFKDEVIAQIPQELEWMMNVEYPDGDGRLSVNVQTFKREQRVGKEGRAWDTRDQ